MKRILSLLACLTLVPVAAFAWTSGPFVSSGAVVQAQPGYWYNCNSTGELVLPHPSRSYAYIGIRNTGASGTCTVIPATSSDKIGGASSMTVAVGVSYTFRDDHVGDWDVLPNNNGVLTTASTIPLSALTPAPSFTIGWDGYLGIVTNAATKTIVAPCAGHFTSLSCTASLTGTCTTAPVINVTNVTGSTTGTSITLTTTVGTPVTHSETLTFAATNVIGLAQTASPGTCTVPWFACAATLSCP